MRYYDGSSLSYMEKDHIRNSILKLPDRLQAESLMAYAQPASSHWNPPSSGPIRNGDRLSQQQVPTQEPIYYDPHSRQSSAPPISHPWVSEVIDEDEPPHPRGLKKIKLFILSSNTSQKDPEVKPISYYIIPS
jgi:hypothetical protein